jgi:integrase/recombinase XerD
MSRRRRSREDGERSFEELIDLYVAHLSAKGRAEGTAYHYRLRVEDLRRWLSSRGVFRVGHIDAEHLLAYQLYLSKRKGRTTRRRWKACSQRDALVIVSGFFSWLAKTRVIFPNPAEAIELPSVTAALPPRPLTHRQVERILGRIDLCDPLGLRDRAIIETLYSTGIRHGELRALDVDDVDATVGLLCIRHGKGGKGRIVPIGDRAVHWLERYLTEVRPRHLLCPDEKAMFLSVEGGRLCDERINERLKRLGMKQHRRVHLFRHTVATVMLERGADLRYVQELLGHRQITTTTVYTRVSIDALKKVHQRTHPAERARPKRRRRRDEEP